MTIIIHNLDTGKNTERKVKSSRPNRMTPHLYWESLTVTEKEWLVARAFYSDPQELLYLMEQATKSFDKLDKPIQQYILSVVNPAK